MRFRFREDRATQAAGRLIEQEGGAINHMKLVKLLYLADREALIRWGRPISFDYYYSMPHGPVLSFTLNLVNEEPDPSAPSYWHQYISAREGHCVRLIANTPNDQLSPAEQKLLEDVYNRFGGMDQWQLRDYTHTLQEWRDPNGSSEPIAVERILLAGGLSREEARAIQQDLEAETGCAW